MLLLKSNFLQFSQQQVSL